MNSLNEEMSIKTQNRHLIINIIVRIMHVLLFTIHTEYNYLLNTYICITIRLMIQLTSGI